MDIEDLRWQEYEDRFRALAERVPMHKGPKPELAGAQQYLFLYGDNGLPPEQELAVLARFEKEPERLQGIEILTSYWEDLVLYLP